MPGLRGNLCWGNRGSFTIYGEYPSAGLDPTEVHVSPAPGTFVSTNAYYGHHRVPSESTSSPEDVRMDVSEDPDDSSSTWTQNSVTRKRLLQDPVFHSFKRIRQGDC
uniref:Uncharacterized protein n=1 Tax=Lygus hesperus TaxID=30085 RepID=A0A0A9ZHY2_LYGHE